jgi:3-deoxy-7-phosphoheptulonate synthase
MIITVSRSADLGQVRRTLAGLGLWVAAPERRDDGDTLLVVQSSSTSIELDLIRAVPGVVGISKPESAHPRVDGHGPVAVVGKRSVSRDEPILISGPCSVESPEQIERIARSLREKGVTFLRGGAFKPRTSPYAFQGRGPDALSWLRAAADACGMAVVTEVLSEHDVSTVAEHAEVLQIGSRNMHNYALLKAVGKVGKPVLLKRSMAATVEEWLLAGEYLLSHGSGSVMFCERGVRTFDETTRNLLDLGAVALLAHVHNLPVIVDPSHGTGRRDLIVPLARAALAAGAAGVMIEVHDRPEEAQSDAPQALHPDALAPVLSSLRGAS